MPLYRRLMRPLLRQYSAPEGRRAPMSSRPRKAGSVCNRLVVMSNQIAAASVGRYGPTPVLAHQRPRISAPREADIYGAVPPCARSWAFWCPLRAVDCHEGRYTLCATFRAVPRS